MNLTEEEMAGLRDRLSREKAVELIPTSLYVFVLMIIGLIGNVLVCVFYSRKSRVTPTSRLIVAVAVIDTIICILMPKNIADISLSYKFTSSALCKLNNFVNHTTAVSSVSVLVAIAVFRFRAVCRPFGRQFTVRHANISVIIGVVISVLASAPVLFTHESVPIQISVEPNGSIVGYDCNTSKKPSLKSLNLFVNVLHFFILVSTTTSFIILYGKMGYNILKYYKTKKILTGKPMSRIKSLKTDAYTDSSDSHMHETTTEVMSENSADKDTHKDGDNFIKADKCQMDDKQPDDSDIKTSDSESKTIDFDNDKTDVGYTNQNVNEEGNCDKKPIDIHVGDSANYGTHKQDKEISTQDTKPATVAGDDNYNIPAVAVKQTVMLCIITVIFVCSFLPYIAMNLSRTLSKNKDGDDDFTNWIQFCTRSYLINSASNPFVYGLFNSEFRYFAKRMLCCGCRK